MDRNKNTQQLLRGIPIKWAIALIACILLYALIQPQANSRLGWTLPSIASLLGEDPAASEFNRTAPSLPPKSPENRAEARERNSKDQVETSSVGLAPSDAVKSDIPKRDAPKTSEVHGSSSNGDNKLYGLLTDIGNRRYRSPAGLIYGPGSEEGHRLKHVEKHLSDEANRSGKHGVFDGDMASVIRWIDDAFERGERGARGTTTRREDGRTVIEANFEKPIGYIGGRDGKRNGNPPAKRLRLVVDENKIITAFPF